jgi:transposase
LKPQNAQPRVRLGGGFAGVGVTALARVDGNINTSTYIAILQQHLLPLQLPQFPLTFQQDNAPAHKSQTNINWLQDNKISIMDWPPQSLDLNPIENIWADIKHRLQSFEIREKQELWLAVKQIWDEYPTDYSTKFAHTMPSRIAAVIHAHVSNTRF